MIFNIEFDKRALKEWQKLDQSIKEQFKKKLKKLQENPYIESARLKGDLSGCYKIKLRASGFRLVYQVIAIGKREESKAYSLAEIRIKKYNTY